MTPPDFATSSTDQGAVGEAGQPDPDSSSAGSGVGLRSPAGDGDDATYLAVLPSDPSPAGFQSPLVRKVVPAVNLGRLVEMSPTGNRTSIRGQLQFSCGDDYVYATPAELVAVAKHLLLLARQLDPARTEAGLAHLADLDGRRA